MRMQQLIRTWSVRIALSVVTLLVSIAIHAEPLSTDEAITIDRIQLASQQIDLLKGRLKQSEQELGELQRQQDQPYSTIALEKASKKLLDKASLEMSVSRSNLDSINIELADTQQTVSWLDKNIQEIENQLNVLHIFGVKLSINESTNIAELASDLTYLEKLQLLEKNKIKYLKNLQSTANNVLLLKNESYTRLNAVLKSHRVLHVKQEQVKDELAYQEQQNYWLQQVNASYLQLARIDPASDKAKYAEVERDIFYANERASFAYIQSLIARYKDQIQQMKVAISKGNSISLLNEISDQMTMLNKQIGRLDKVLKSRMMILDKHEKDLAPKKQSIESVRLYLERLSALKVQYQASNYALHVLSEELTSLHRALDFALKRELSSRQGFPAFSVKAFKDFGKELLLVPALSFQVVKSLTIQVANSFYTADYLAWVLFFLAEALLAFSFFFLRAFLQGLLEKPALWQEQLNSKWLSLQWLRRSLLDIFVIGNVIGALYFFNISLSSFIFVIYFSFVWLTVKSIIIIARLCLVETTHDAAGHDMMLFRRLKWIALIGGVIIAMTISIHQLPLIFELKSLCARLFLFYLLIVSLQLLRSCNVVPNLIRMRMESQHPYFERSMRLISILVPLLLFANSIIGLIGYLNLVIAISWYEGVFVLVLIGYLMLRGLLSDGMLQLSSLMIQHLNNGWLWTEAFLKPLDKVLRVALFFIAFATLFIFHGWDRQSVIVENLNVLLHYQLITVLNSTITPMHLAELTAVVSLFYWLAKWIREFVYRFLSSRTQDMGIRNSLAVLSQYFVIVMCIFISLHVLGINLRALTFVASAFALGIGLGLRDLANNFACDFLLLLERPVRVGDIVNINGTEGEVLHVGSRAVTEIRISRYDNPHQVRLIIQEVLIEHKAVLKDPAPNVFLRSLSDTLMEFEIRFYVNIFEVKSKISVTSDILMKIWDVFEQHGIKPPYPQHEVFLRSDSIIPTVHLQDIAFDKKLI